LLARSNPDGTPSVQTLKSQGWTQPQSNYSGQIDYTINSTSLLSVRGGRFWDNYRSWGIPNYSSIIYQIAAPNLPGLPADLQQLAGWYNTPRVINTFFDITTRTYVQTDFAKFVGGWLGSHDIKTGTGYQKNINKVDNTYPGAATC
jgi:hypothetical protein